MNKPSPVIETSQQPEAPVAEKKPESVVAQSVAASSRKNRGCGRKNQFKYS